MFLNKIEQLLLAFEVIVKPRKGYPCCPANVPYGSALETPLGEDLCRMTKDVLQLGFGIARDGNTSGHSLCRTFVRKLYPSQTIVSRPLLCPVFFRAGGSTYNS